MDFCKCSFTGVSGFYKHSLGSMQGLLFRKGFRVSSSTAVYGKDFSPDLSTVSILGLDSDQGRWVVSSGPRP